MQFGGAMFFTDYSMSAMELVPMFPPEKADTVLPIVDRWTKIMQQVNR